MIYTLDFETIQQAMQAHRKTGFLSAEVAAGVTNLREPCRIEVKVVTGAVVSCAIVGSSGRRITGKEATQAIVRLGRLRWTFTPEQEVAVQQLSPARVPASGYAVMPRRSAYVDQGQMRSWSRLHRAVFALADGTKSMSKIAEILSTAPELVERTVRDLQSIGVIVVEPQNRNSY